MSRICRPITRKGGIVSHGGPAMVDFSSNDYLGFSTHPELALAGVQSLQHFPVGSTGSRLLSGDYDLYHELENNTSHLMKTESALVFNSGYQANVGIMGAILGRKDVVFADKHIHASLLDGIRLSQATLLRFKHQDMDHLNHLLEETEHNCQEIHLQNI